MTKDPLLQLVRRRHPVYAEKIGHWNFVDATYEGGPAWFADNIFRYMKEGDRDYRDRVERAYRFNHTKQVVDLVDKYLFKMSISRKDDAPDSVKRYWKDTTRSGLDADGFFKRVSTATSMFGRIYIVVDSTATEGVAASKADEVAGDARVYTYIVRPQDMLDMSVDELGVLNWVLFREHGRDDASPLTSTGKFRKLYRLWTRTSWTLYEEKSEGRGPAKVVQIETGTNSIGKVPVVIADHNFSDNVYSAPSLIDDVAYLDRANANYLSNLDAIIQDQTFSQLTMPAQGLVAGEDGGEKLVKMGTSRIFTYNGESPHRPEYISPDPGQANLILAAVTKIITEIYSSVGLTAERTGSNDGGGESSGVAKAYDFEKVNSLLAAKAAALELTERNVARMVAEFSSEQDQMDDDFIKYPIDFDVRGIYDEFEIGARLSLLAAPEEVRREQMRLVIKKLFPAASKELNAKLEDSLKLWPPEIIAPGLGDKSAGPAGPLKAAGIQKTAKEMAS